MGVGVQTGGSVPQRAGALRQPAYGEHPEEPDVEAQDQGSEQVWPDSRLVRLAQWPLLVSLAVLEIAWLIVLVYAIHRFFLDPILG